MNNFYQTAREASHQIERLSDSPSRGLIYRAVPVEDVRATHSKPLNARKYLGQSQQKAQHSWLQEAQQQCKGLKELPSNWDSYGAETPNSMACYWAGEALIIVNRLGLPEPRVAASVENGIGLTLRKGAKSATIEFFNDGDTVAVRSDGTGFPFAWDVVTDLKSIEDALNQMRDYVYG